MSQSPFSVRSRHVRKPRSRDSSVYMTRVAWHPAGGCTPQLRANPKAEAPLIPTVPPALIPRKLKLGGGSVAGH